MNISEIIHTIECDACGRRYNGNPNYFTDEVEAECFAIAAGWHVYNGRHYCPACMVMTEDGPITKAMRLGEFIQMLLDKEGMKQEDAAKEIGLTVAKLNEVIHGKRNVTHLTARKLQARFGVPSLIFRLWQMWEDEIYGVPKITNKDSK